MENQSNFNQDCGCSDGCCTPQKKSNPWKKWIFIAIILAAVAIIAVKFIGKDDATPEKCCEKPETCCPQSNTQ
ncbi:MAG: hypothetical protein FWF09_05900, partial [Bacteroidales bacterium]|nr:hypothetical protein [Bacteroidales bacterium]